MTIIKEEIEFVRTAKTESLLNALYEAENIIQKKIHHFGLNKRTDFSALFNHIQVNEKRLKHKYDVASKWSAFWAGAIVAIVAAAVGATPQAIEEYREVHQGNNKVQLIQIVHDTVYKTIQNDTSLVRLVKLPTTK